jgi:hypothetical protein
MYAAGHPPLPGIEVETYAEAMPSHWRRLGEKGNFQFRDEYLAANRPLGVDARETGFPRTKAVLAGGVVAWRESLRLFAAQAALQSKPGAKLEYAAYDCQACHHELQVRAWRQARFERGALADRNPGRPVLPEWPRALTKAGLAPFDNSGQVRRELDALNEQLRSALGIRPFGGPDQPAEAAERAGAIVEFLDAKLPHLAAVTIDDKIAVSILRQLYELPAAEWPDFHSARQIGWAIRAIETELRTMPRFPKPLLAIEVETAKQRGRRADLDLENYYNWQIQSRQSAADDANRFLQRLNDYLSLDLPADQRPIADTSLDSWLMKAGTYDPREFRARLKQAAIDAGRVKNGDQRVSTLRAH